MTAFATRSLLTALLMVGVVSACARRTGSKPADSGAQPSPSVGNVVTSEDIERNPGKPIEQILEERFPGVEVVRRSDGGLSLRIRGATSVNSGTEPLYVIDGVPAVPGPTGGFTGLNPHEILSIQVLKDPGTTAMYGVRGANGVILIKTKRSPPPRQ